ncbi:MAG: HlyD family efflux transporter periplasmic adaptor subunit [Fimbriiglobus sp.]
MKTLKSWLAVSTIGAAALTGLACTPSSSGPSTPATVSTGGTSTAAPMVVGNPLYAAAAMPNLQAGVPVGEPVIIPNAVVQYDMRLQIPSSVDAVIEMIAVPVEPGQVKPGDTDIIYHPRDVNKTQPYRRLRENDIIRQGQVLARLDEQVVGIQAKQYQEMLPELEKQIDASQAATVAQKQVYDLTEKTFKSGSSSVSELSERLAMLKRYEENFFNGRKELIKTDGELRSAQAQLAKYWVRSPMNGRVIKIVKNQSEFAKAGETILEMQGLDRVRVEGKVDAGYASQIRKGMMVYVEPARPLGPNPLTNYHRQEVTSIAVTAHTGRPMIVSGGMDAAALVWDVTGTKQSYRLSNPNGVGVKSVATTGSKSKTHLVAVGGDDGKIRIWDISNPDKMPKEPVAVMEEAHNSSVTTLAFTPDGRYLASGSGRDVFLWSIADKKKLYAFPAEHRSDVTMLRFTPQATLVSIAKDKTIRTWKIGDTGANVAMVIDHRGGAVDVLGVSSDGSRVLFDKDATRLDLVSLGDERSVGTVQSAGSSTRFGNFAIFSSDDSLILTAGAENDQRGELTVWETPQPGNRASERRRLVTPRNAAITTAAFSPDATHKFVAVGTTDGGVYYWTAPTEGEGKRLTGEVVSIVPIDTKSAQVRIEMANPIDKTTGEGLQDRGAATIIIPPGGAPAAVAPAMPNTQVPPAPGGVIPASAVIPAAPMPTPMAPLPPVVAPPAAIPPVTAPPAPTPVILPGNLGNPVVK